MNFSDRFVELAIVRQLLLQRVQAGSARKVNALYTQLADDIEASMRKSKEFTTYQNRRIDSAIRELKTMVAGANSMAASTLAEDLEDLAGQEAKWTIGAINTAATVNIATALPAASVLKSIAEKSLVQGATIGAWFGKVDEDLQFQIERTIKTGVALGRTNAQLARDIIGMGDKGGEPLAKTRRDANAIVRTSVQTVSNNAALESYRANSDVIAGVVWLATLDSRTTDICAARSGKQYTLDGEPVGHKIPFNGGPPAHWNCRSRIVPKTKTFRELGIDIDEFAPGTQASAFGQAPADLSFDEFLRKQPKEFADEMLGKGRAELWRNKTITLSQLLDQRGNPLTLAELRERHSN
jgi:SPP1 gp7 family putative phage head morphogenesis protein